MGDFGGQASYPIHKEQKLNKVVVLGLMVYKSFFVVLTFTL